MLGRIAILLSAVAFSTVVLAYLAYAEPAQAAYPCSGKHVYPSQNLASVADNSPRGTTFCIHDGTYNISNPVMVQNNDRFIGLYNDSTRPAVVTSQAKALFDAMGTSGALIKGLKISGAVGGNFCEPNCGRGISGGDKLTVYDVWVTGNKNQGIGATGSGLLVQNSIIERNGSYAFANDDGSPMSAGIKSSLGSITVLNSKIRDNYWSGVWVDGGNTFTVKNSILTGNGKTGIHNEIANGPAVFAGNTIKGNGTLASAPRRAGMVIVESSNVDAYGNTFGGNAEHGVFIADGIRHALRDVKFHDNTMNGDTRSGCNLSGVSCYGNK